MRSACWRSPLRGESACWRSAATGRELGDALLAVVEGAVEGIRGVEVGVRASRDDFAVIENDDRRGVADRGKTVRDD